MKKSTRSPIIFLFAALYAFTVLAVAFHHHEDDRPHADCSVCVAGSLFSPAHPAVHPTIHYFSILCCYERQALSNCHARPECFTFLSRGPPAHPAV
jgi:hypothetical protein